MRKLLPVALLCVLSLACKKKEAAAPAAENPPTTTASAAAPAAPAATPAAAATESDLLAIGAGGVVVQKPQEYNDAYGAYRLLDEASDRGWSTPDGVVSPQTMVFALPGRCEIARVEFDTDGLKPGRAAKDVVVEISDDQKTFTKIAQGSLAENANHQSFPVSATVPGRWVRLTVQNNHGDKDNIELLEVRAFGKQLDRVTVASLTGDYTTNSGDMQLRQDGASVVGCFGTNGGKLTGGIDGRTLKFTWSAGDDSGTAVVNFTDDAKSFFGVYWNKGETGAGTVWSGDRATGTIAGCGLTSNSAEEQLAKELESAGRTRVYGINFDVDSATIRPESKATLDDIASVLKSKAAWSLTIEGHTDSTGGDAHNQQLSEQRAASVKSYLVNAGIAETRLATQGFGASQPVAPNETEIGRAQNRRVELVRK